MNTAIAAAAPAAIPFRYQPIFEIAQAYQALQPSVAAELEECFTGNRNYAEYLDTARKIVHTTAPDALALILARLIAVTTDTTDIGDTEAATATAPEVTPQPLVHQIRTSLNAIPAELRSEFLAVQTRDIDLEAIADMAQRVTAQLAPCDMWRVLAGQLLVTAADNQLLRARFAAMQRPTSAASLDEFSDRGDMVTVARAHALALPLSTPKAQVEAALDERLRLLIQRVGAAEPELLQRMQRVVMVETLDMALHGLRCCSDIDLADDIERLLAVACSN